MANARRLMDGASHRFSWHADAGRYQIHDAMEQYTFAPEAFESHAQAICDGLNTLHYCGILPALLGIPEPTTTTKG